MGLDVARIYQRAPRNKESDKDKKTTGEEGDEGVIFMQEETKK